jgi:hypothetical protein
MFQHPLSPIYVELCVVRQEAMRGLKPALIHAAGASTTSLKDPTLPQHGNKFIGLERIKQEFHFEKNSNCVQVLSLLYLTSII